MATKPNPDDPQTRQNMVPTFLGVLSKAPQHVQEAADTQTEIPHPFSKSVPALKKAPKVAARPQINPGHGGQVFSAAPRNSQMTLSPPTPGREEHQKLRNNYQEIRDNSI